MTYLTIALMGDDQLLRLRVAACAAQEGAARDGADPDAWAHAWRRDWASGPGWDTAWESGLASGIPSGEIGGRPDVITDGMILAQVQPMKPFRMVGQEPPPAPRLSVSAALPAPVVLTGTWQPLLALDAPAEGPWTVSGTWTGGTTTAAAEFRVNGGTPLRSEPKDAADRALVTASGWTGGGPLTVEGRTTDTVPGRFTVHTLSAWWLAAG